MKIFRFCMAYFFVLLCTSCTFFAGVEDVRCVLPEFTCCAYSLKACAPPAEFCTPPAEFCAPPAEAGNFSEDEGCGFCRGFYGDWIVSVYREEGTQCFLVSGSTEFVLKCVQNKPVAVLAVPVVHSDNVTVDFFKPAGAILDYDRKNDRVELTFEGGFTACIMKTLFENAYHSGDFSLIEHFNWAKFESALKDKMEKEGDVFYNPWKLDFKNIVSAIACNSFRTTLLDLRGVIDFDLNEALEGDGFVSSYMPENQNIVEKGRICVKQSEVNLISDYNLRGIIVTVKSEKNVSLKYSSLPIYNKGYE